MYSLFINTYDQEIIIALFKDEILLDSKIKTSERHHSDYTMPLISSIISDNNITVHDLNEILVINGPGSFTGVRIGVTIAKTLAYTLNIPIKTMTSLEMHAVSSNINNEKIITVNDIKGVYVGHFDKFNNIIGNLFYLSNKEFEEYIKNNNYENIYISDLNVNLDSIYKRFKTIEQTNPHLVNPIYIKQIEALKDDKENK